MSPLFLYAALTVVNPIYERYVEVPVQNFIAVREDRNGHLVLTRYFILIYSKSRIKYIYSES